MSKQEEDKIIEAQKTDENERVVGAEVVEVVEVVERREGEQDYRGTENR